RGGIRASVLPRNAHRAPSSVPPARIRLRQTFPRWRAGRSDTDTDTGAARRRTMRLSSSLLAVYFAAVGAVSTLAAAPAAAPQYFVVCGSAPNQPTVYFSGVIQAQPAAFQQL